VTIEATKPSSFPNSRILSECHLLGVLNSQRWGHDKKDKYELF
jgi:hypothetical protein